MTHVILGHCCKDASCVQVCPRNSIHPMPGEAGFESAETLHIDPRSCIDCTACVDACPASAIKPDHALTGSERRYAERNRQYFALRPAAPSPISRRPRFAQPLASSNAKLRVAVVGAGPAAMYTVRELLRRSSSVRITVFEKDSMIGGLVRTGVSPDQVGVRGMIRLFDVPFSDDRVDVVYNTEVGVAVSVAELTADFDAVVLACGATQPRRVGGRDAGIVQALDILLAANDIAPDSHPPALAGPRCVVVGAGNVALDVVRHVAQARERAVTEMIVLSRSPADRVSFTASAFDGLRDLDTVDLMLDAVGINFPATGSTALLDDIARLPTVRLDDRRGPLDRSGALRVVLSFGQNVTAVEHLRPGDIAVVTAGGRTFRANSVIGAAGFTTKIDGVPVGEAGAVPNRRGKVVSPETGEPLDRLYVVGWARRGATGGVGDNRSCAAETVAQLTADLAAGR